ncbi:hypothetical protein SpCBS45565_g06613 [Spizellomyces sp. 'palustris']|nr:hypothetical protein SpCBS45565_g06613 [Spizellomyces sp. 'palustris']
MGVKLKFDGPFDPLCISTIEEDDEVPVVDEEEEEEDFALHGAQITKDKANNPGQKQSTQTAKPGKKEKKAKKLKSKQNDAPTTTQPPPKSQQSTDKKPDDLELNPDFSFDADGGLSLVGPSHPWDFTSVKAAIKQQMKDTISTTVDEKIERRRGKVNGAADTKRKLLADEEEDKDFMDDGSEDEEISDDDEGVIASDSPDDDSVNENAEGEDMFDDGTDGDESEGEQDDEVVTTQHRHRDSDDEEDDADEPDDIVQEKKKAEYFAPAPEVEESTTEAFTSMRLSRPILKGIAAMGFVKPTAIQARTIPIAMQGKDICGSAVTGSGKTAAFIIPVLERLLFRPKNVATTRVLILVPTRELGVQCHSVAVNLAKFSDIQFCLCVGGLSTKTQEVELRARPDVVIATPGRLIDHIRNSRSFNLDSVEILIMDEADRMLEDGFADELNEIIKNTPKSRQTMLFSATMTDNVDDLIKLSLNRPVRLFVDSSTSIANRLVQEFIRVRAHREESRPAILAALCTRTYASETIVFFRSKAAAHHMKIVFGLLGLKAAELHGNLTQLQRLEALEQFRDKQVDFLLATDLASRGLDIAGIKTVINYDMPRNYAQYVHRIGRTARGGAGGRAVSLVGEADRNVLKMAVKNSRDEVKHRIVPSQVVQKYERRIEKFKDTVKDIYAEEKEEKEMRKAEMEISKAQNIMEHEAEIKSRPARTWFQTEKEKAQAKELGLAKHHADFGLDSEEPNSKKRKAAAQFDDDAPKRTSLSGLSRKKKRTKLAREEDAKELATQARVARTVKKQARPQKLAVVSEPRPFVPKPTKRREGGFDSEMGTSKKKTAKKTVTKTEPVQKKREPKKLGKVRSVKAFKSKSKFKRR